MTGRLISLCVTTTLIIFLAITFYQVVAPFLLPLFLAGIAAVICQPVFQWFTARMPTYPRLAAGVTTGTVVGVFLVPIALIIFVMTAQLASTVKGVLADGAVNHLVDKIQTEFHIDRVAARLEPVLGSEVDETRLKQEIQRNVEKASTWLANQTVGLAGSAIGLLGGMVTLIVQLGMFVIALYYFLADGPGFLNTAQSLIPMEGHYQQDLITRFNDTIRAVVAGTFIAALVQGLLTAIMLRIFGIPNFVMIFVLAGFCSLIPMLGTALVWGPVALWFAANGQIVEASLLTALGALVIGSTDNVIRAYVLQSGARLHPLLAFVCVLGGIQVMGLWGIFIGPLVASILHALIEIFNSELVELSQERTQHGPPEPLAHQPESLNATPEIASTPATDNETPTL